MFEALVSLCLVADPTACREVLLPGFEASAQSTCAEALRAQAPDLVALFPTLAPGVPPRCGPVGTALDFEEAAPGVFVHLGRIAEPDRDNLGDVANIGFVIGQESVAVIDTGTTRAVGEGVWRAIRARTDLPVSHVILTHMHPDHVLGASVFVEAGAQVVANAALARALLDRQANYLESIATLVGPGAFVGTRAPRPDLAVEDRTQIDLGGGRILTLRTWPVSHTGTDLTVHDEGSGLLFAGDLVFQRHLPALDGSLRGWQRVMADMAALPVTRVVPGHGGPVLDWPDAAKPMQRYLDVLAADTRQALDAGVRLGDAVLTIAESERPRWALFDAYNPRNATNAFTELEWE
ncbi:quinoprotein relay system zinc metallohydrolase 2 [Thalassococcus sp. BH17M4-6]|uniref:quinoprotein relay system zinc metallohydrolase 2 n=1 Tax=Thalassococcus sp. BH17M4-6 TaxID=3413148 RepID=UPI003BE71D51